MINEEVENWVSRIQNELDANGKISLSLEGEADNHQAQGQKPVNGTLQYTGIRGITLEDLSGMIAQLNNVIGQNSSLLLENVVQLVQKNEVANRNKKQKRIAEKILFSSGEYPMVIFQFDNGRMQSHVLTESVTGDFKVFQLDFGGYEECEKFGILFSAENMWIIGTKRRVKGRYLYECCLKAGIKFNPEIPKNSSVRVLHEFFAPMIENAQQKYIFSPFAGWNDKKFYDGNNFIWQKTTEFPDLPIFHKHFGWMEYNNQAADIYFKYLGQVNLPQDRVVLTVLPFISCISSIIKKEWQTVPFFVNFVVMDEFDWSNICRVIQIFNRDDLQPNSLDITSKELEKILQSANDECLIFDATYSGEDSYYIANKLSNAAIKVGNLLTGRMGKKKGQKEWGSATAAIFSSKAYQQRNCFNIYVDKEFWKDNGSKLEFCSMHAMDRVLTAFILFVENNFDEVCEKIRRRRNETDVRKITLEIIEDILQDFWERKGIQMKELMNLPIDFHFFGVIKEEIIEEDLLQLFISGVRKSLSELYAEERSAAINYSRDVVYYDDDNLYLTTYVFRQILNQNGLDAYRSEILLELEKLGAIKRGRNGFLEKRNIGKERHNVFSVPKELFNDIGLVDIISVAKEVEL